MNEMVLRQLGLFVGVFLRLAIPAFIAWYNAESFEWEHKYSKQFIYAAVIGFVAVTMGYTDPEPGWSNQQVFWFSIKDGYLLKEAVNLIRKWDEQRIDKILREGNG